MIKKFRDLLALILATIIFPILWVGAGYGWLNLPESIIGATISIETMIAMFYFRKMPSNESPN